MTIRVRFVNGTYGCGATAIDHGIGVTAATPLETLTLLKHRLAEKFQQPITLAVGRA